MAVGSRANKGIPLRYWQIIRHSVRCVSGSSTCSGEQVAIPDGGICGGISVPSEFGELHAASAHA
jgi:hypothetical protein